MKVTIKQWVPVAVWQWPNADVDDMCGICRANFESTCPGCILPGTRCPPVKGHCTHTFHRHCIIKWLRLPSSAGQCPMCRQKFQPEGDEALDFERYSGSSSMGSGAEFGDPFLEDSADIDF